VLPWLLVLPWSGASAAVIIEGVRGSLRENVLAHLSLGSLPCDAPAWRVKRLRQQATREAQDALEAYGFYSARVSITAETPAECWEIRVQIEPGEPVRLRTVTVNVTGEGADDAAFRRLLKANPLAVGEPLQHETYEKYKKSFFDSARRRGFFSGDFTDRRIEIYAADRAADVTLAFATGPRYHFGEIGFEQNVVAPRLVERFVDFRAGEDYDGDKVASLYNALLSTGYFSSVDVQTVPGTPPDVTVPVRIRLSGAKKQVYTVGAGYSTDIGPKFRAGYTNRRLNAFGHQFDLNASVSPVQTEAGVSYRLPQRDPRVEWLSFDLGYKYEDTDTNRTEVVKTGAKQLVRLWHDWIETRFLDVSLEKFRVAEETRREFLVIPGVSLSHTTTTASSRPTSGHRVVLKLSGTANALGSGSQFLQTEILGKLILPAWEGARVLVRAEMGATAKESFADLPASVRFFAGGDSSVRGYDYKSLGPRDANGLVTGGSHKLIGSVEFDQKVLDNWSVAAFLDSGNSFDSFANLRLKTGVGAGFRWYSPLGPVRFDVAVPLARDAPDAYRIHITLGPDL
jgi:translocation and assembly module TamA